MPWTRDHAPKIAAAHALQSFSWERDLGAPNENNARLVVQKGALPFLIELCQTKETADIGLTGLANLTCLQDVRFLLITEGVFETMLFVIADKVARSKVSVDSVLDAIGRMCVEPGCAKIVMGDGPRKALGDLSHSESSETRRLAEYVLNISS